MDTTGFVIGQWYERIDDRKIPADYQWYACFKEYRGKARLLNLGTGVTVTKPDLSIRAFKPIGNPLRPDLGEK